MRCLPRFVFALAASHSNSIVISVGYSPEPEIQLRLPNRLLMGKFLRDLVQSLCIIVRKRTIAKRIAIESQGGHVVGATVLTGKPYSAEQARGYLPTGARTSTVRPLIRRPVPDLKSGSLSNHRKPGKQTLAVDQTI